MFAHWQTQNVALVNSTIKRWPTLSVMERVIVMEGLARICPRHSMLDWGNATAFDQQKLQNIAAFSDILSTLNNHSKLHADRWANFDENELCTPQNIKGDVYHRHMDNQVHAALKSHLVRGQDQRSHGRNYSIHGTPISNTYSESLTPSHKTQTRNLALSQLKQFVHGIDTAASSVYYHCE